MSEKMLNEGEGRVWDAISLAVSAHRGQVYRGYGEREDEPYALHPIRVAARVSPRAKVVALLHDVWEDHPSTAMPPWLSRRDWEAILILRRVKEVETYAEYIAQVMRARGEAGDIAREVKLADIRENLSRNPPPRLRERYEAALAVLAPETAHPEKGSVKP